MNKAYIAPLSIALSPLLFFGATAFAKTAPVPLPPSPVKNGYTINKNFDIVPTDPKGNKKVILITIDDGPGSTDKDLAATLKKHAAKAIFFINGIHDKANAGNIKMLFDAGFPIGNHTWDHANLKLIKDKAKIEKEISDDSALIEKLTGQAPRFFRPPYGASNAVVRQIVDSKHMIFMNWSGAAKDWEKSTKEEKVFDHNVMSGLHSGEILLLHGHPWTAKYLDNLLTFIEEKGYTFADPNDIVQ